MKKSPSILIILASAFCLTSGCAGLGIRLDGVKDTREFRQQVSKQRLELRQAEREAERRELETLRRAELRELKRNQVQMVPELRTVMANNLSQKLTNIRLVPDYKAMAQTAAALSKLEEENEKRYQEDLAKWLRDEMESKRSYAQLTSWRGPRGHHHGHGCNCNCCEPEPNCGQPNPPRQPLRKPPEKQPLPKLPLKYKIEFDIEADVDSAEFLESIPGRAPLKERCLPQPKDCGCTDRNCTDPSCTKHGSSNRRRAAPYDYAAPKRTPPSDPKDIPPKPVPSEDSTTGKRYPKSRNFGGYFQDRDQNSSKTDSWLSKQLARWP